jgi:hypothetical protein
VKGQAEIVLVHNLGRERLIEHLQENVIREHVRLPGKNTHKYLSDPRAWPQRSN